MAFLMRIGSLDITKFVATGGFGWERNDIDAPNSGRDNQGKMHRKIVARKDRLNVTCRQLSTAELKQLVAALKPDTVQIQYYCPGDAANRTATFYTSKVAAGIVQDTGNEVLLNGISFNAIEV